MQQQGQEATAAAPAAVYMAVYWVPSPAAGPAGAPAAAAAELPSACGHAMAPQWFPMGVCDGTAPMLAWQESNHLTSQVVVPANSSQQCATECWQAPVQPLEGRSCEALSECSTEASAERDFQQCHRWAASASKDVGLASDEVYEQHVPGPETAAPSAAGEKTRRRRPPRSKRERDPAPMVPLRAGRATVAGRPAQPRRAARTNLKAASTSRSEVVQQAFDAGACRELQRVLQEVPQSEAARMAGELRGFVREALESPHANHVIQAIVVLLPAETCSFVSEELVGCAEAVARHRYGCRLLCRLVEHHAGMSPTTGVVIDEVVSAAESLCRNEFGKHVLKSILEHGSVEQRRRIAEALGKELLRNATHRAASYVVEHALEHSEVADREALARPLTSAPDVMLALARSQAGCHVIRSLIKTATDGARHRIVAILQDIKHHMESMKYGRLLMADLHLLAPG